MRKIIIVALLCLSTELVAQANDNHRALLEKTRTLYDTPFRRGLISFDCAVNFDFRQSVVKNFGLVPPGAAQLVDTLQPVKYRIFVDMSGATVSAQPKLPDLSGTPNATVVEESNRNLMQIGLGNWIPHAAGEVLPLGQTKYHFTRSANGYMLSMSAENLNSVLSLDSELKITAMAVKLPMLINATTAFTNGPSGLLLTEAATNANNTGLAQFKYKYQSVDGFQLPAFVTLTSPQNQVLQFSLTDCKTKHGIVLKVQPPPGT